MNKKLARGLVSSAILIFVMFGCETSGGDGNNHAPVITSLPNTAAISCELYSYDVKARDADNFVLTFALKIFPEGMTINAQTGEITWLPTLRQVGNQLVEVRVSDGEAYTSQKFAVRVSPLDNGVPFMRGFTLVSWWNDSYLQPQTAASLLQMRKDGVEWVSILATWYQDTTSSTSMAPSDTVTPSDAAVVQAITLAHALGLKVSLKPHIDLRSGDWRGEIEFSDEADWQTWFTNYNAFLGHYLDLAEQNHAELVIIGTELMRTESRDADWRNTIALARARFSGLLTYDTNHSSLLNIDWWDALDFIGVSAYFPLTGVNNPSVADLKAAWAAGLPMLRAYAALYNKDVVFTEIGYMSRDGANMAPWDYHLGSPPDRQEQADCYQAALESLYAEPWFKGMYWWAWSWDPSTDNDAYDIFNKPAELMLRHWYAGY